MASHKNPADKPSEAPGGSSGASKKHQSKGKRAARGEKSGATSRGFPPPPIPFDQMTPKQKSTWFDYCLTERTKQFQANLRLQQATEESVTAANETTRANNQLIKADARAKELENDQRNTANEAQSKLAERAAVIDVQIREESLWRRKALNRVTVFGLVVSIFAGGFLALGVPPQVLKPYAIATAGGTATLWSVWKARGRIRQWLVKKFRRGAAMRSSLGPASPSTLL